MGGPDPNTDGAPEAVSEEQFLKHLDRQLRKLSRDMLSGVGWTAAAVAFGGIATSSRLVLLGAAAVGLILVVSMWISGMIDARRIAQEDSAETESGPD